MWRVYRFRERMKTPFRGASNSDLPVKFKRRPHRHIDPKDYYAPKEKNFLLHTYGGDLKRGSWLPKCYQKPTEHKTLKKIILKRTMNLWVLSCTMVHSLLKRFLMLHIWAKFLRKLNHGVRFDIQFFFGRCWFYLKTGPDCCC